MKSFLIFLSTFMSCSSFAGQGTIMKVPASEVSVLQDQTLIFTVKQPDFEMLRDAEIAEIGQNKPAQILFSTDELIQGIQADGKTVFVIIEKQ